MGNERDHGRNVESTGPGPGGIPTLVEDATQPLAPRVDVLALAQSHREIQVEMLAERLSRAVDALVARLTEQDGVSLLDALFTLYEAEILTKGDVRRRAGLEPEDFYDQLHLRIVPTIPVGLDSTAKVRSDGTRG